MTNCHLLNGLSALAFLCHVAIQRLHLFKLALVQLRKVGRLPAEKDLYYELGFPETAILGPD